MPGLPSATDVASLSRQIDPARVAVAIHLFSKSFKCSHFSLLLDHRIPSKSGRVGVCLCLPCARSTKSARGATGWVKPTLNKRVKWGHSQDLPAFIGPDLTGHREDAWSGKSSAMFHLYETGSGTVSHADRESVQRRAPPRGASHMHDRACYRALSAMPRRGQPVIASNSHPFHAGRTSKKCWRRRR